MRTAIVGLGVIGKVHISVLKDLDAEIVAVCDCDEAKLKEYSAFSTYLNYENMLDEVAPDVVHICTPHYLHAEMIIATLKRNIHVLCEKPLCIRASDINRIKSALKQSKAQLGVCHQNRYNDVNVYLKHYLQDKEILSAHGNVVWRRSREYYEQAAWRGSRDMEGGGVLINQALHTLDLMQWFLGMPKGVVAQIGNFSLKDVIEVEDTASLLCVGNKTFTFFATNASGCNMDTQISVKLTNGDYIVAHPQELYINGEIICHEEIERYIGKSYYGNGHRKLIADFYECLKTCKPFSIDFNEGVKVIQVILAAYKSNGNHIQISE